MVRTELDELNDRIYVLNCAVDDARADLAAGSHSTESLREILDWLLEAAEAITSVQVTPSGS